MFVNGISEQNNNLNTNYNEQQTEMEWIIWLINTYHQQNLPSTNGI